MHIRSSLVVLAGMAAVLSGCYEDIDPVATQLEEAAIIRYVNAVPDTSGLDFRFVDGGIEGSPQFANVTYRQFTPYQRARAGVRRLRVFTNPSIYGNSAAVAAQTHIDTTFTFEVNARYTIVSYGFARSTGTPRHRLVIYRDTLPTLTATQIGVRTIHAAAGVGNVDVYVRPSEAASAISGTPTAANVPPLASTGYLTALAPRPVGTLLYRWDIAPAGTTTGVTVNPASGLPGVAGTTAANPLAGFQVARSVITAMVFGPSVTGSRAPQGGEFSTVGLRFMPDRHLDTTEQ